MALAAAIAVAGCGSTDDASEAGVRGTATTPARVTLARESSTTPGRRLGDGSVPWIEAPRTEASFAIGVTPQRVIEGASSCRADDLRGVLPRWTSIIKRDDLGKRLGNLGLRGIVRVENIGSRPCTLQGRVPFRLLARDRPPEGVSVDTNIDEASQERVTALRPGDAAVLELRWTAPYCGLFPGDQTVELDLPNDGGTLAVPVDRARLPECTGLRETESGTRSFLLAAAFDQERPQTSLDSALNDVKVRVVDPPRRLVPGRLLRYTVELRNPTSTAMPLTDCPGYRVSLADFARNVPPAMTQLESLNCEAVDAIPARGAARFRMVSPVPERLPAGARWSLRWELRSRTLSPSDDTATAFFPKVR